MPDDREVSFGFESFWPKAYEAFPRFWEVYPRLIESINSLITPGYKRTIALQKVVLNLGILGATSLVEINTLVGNGLGYGAMKITRSMLEVAINAEFLRKFPEYVDDYLDWGAVESHRLLRYVRTDAPHLLSQYPKGLQDEIDKDFQLVKHRFETVKPGQKPRVRPGWCAMALDARATETGLQEEYKLVYPIGNKLLHGTIGGMSMHANRSVDRFSRVSVPPSLNYCKLALVGGHTCSMKIIETVSKVMTKEPSPKFDVLTKDYVFAWKKESKSDAKLTRHKPGE
jgi:hypothetical protein